MPKLTTSVFETLNPALTFSAYDQTWKIAKGVTAESIDHVAVTSEYTGSKLVNNGYIHSENWYGAFFRSSDFEIVNKKNGTIVGDEAGIATGMSPISGALIVNYGKVSATAADGSGVYAYDTSNFVLENHGVIKGHLAGVLIEMDSPPAGTKGATIRNEKKIKGDIVGIAADSDPGLKTKVVNGQDGLIKGRDSFGILAVEGPLKVVNKGDIKGGIGALPDANDKVINKGTISGDTYLGAGNDIYKNKDGKADLVSGGYGNDRLVAGDTKDKFLFSAMLDAAGNVDRVEKFEAGKDKVFLDQTIFTALASTGKLGASFFTKGKQAKDADDYLVYHKKSGALYYDFDGNGAGAQVKFAQFDKKTDLSHDDFTVIA